MNYIIRSATLNDVQNIINLNKYVLPDLTYNSDYYTTLIEDFNDLIFVAEHEKNIAGYILNQIDYTSLFFKKKTARKGHMVSLCVHPNIRKMGVASRLIESSITAMINSNCEEYFLYVSTINKRAIDLYSRFGFTKVRTEKWYYPHIFQDAHILALNLPKKTAI